MQRLPFFGDERQPLVSDVFYARFAVAWCLTTGEGRMKMRGCSVVGRFLINGGLWTLINSTRWLQGKSAL